MPVFMNILSNERSFSFADPAAWNALPADLRSQTVRSSFEKQLKIYLLKSALIFFQPKLFYHCNVFIII
jgi:hypothetical protein